jgi:ketosteroid isomerase-like protein
VIGGAVSQTATKTTINHEAEHTMLTIIEDSSIDTTAEDIQQIRQQLAEWQQLFSPGEEQYTLNGYEHLFVQDDELLVFDNFSPENTRFTGFDTYRTTWEQAINKNFPGFVMYHLYIERIEVSGKLAWSALTWWGKVAKDGKIQYTSQHGTHIWYKRDGQWQIVHEHLTGSVKENGQESRR